MTPQEPDELLAGVGLGGVDLTPQQRERVLTAAEATASLYNRENDADLRHEALRGAAMIILEEDGLKGAATQWREALAQADLAHAYLRGAIIGYPGSERGAAGLANVSRETIRKARGK